MSIRAISKLFHGTNAFASDMGANQTTMLTADPSGISCIAAWAAGLGLLAYDVWQEYKQSKDIDALRKQLFHAMMENQAVKVHLQQQAEAQQKAADDIAALDHVDLSKIDPNDPARPYIALYKLIEGQHESVESLQLEIEFTRDRVLEQLETDAISHRRQLVHLANYVRSEFQTVNSLLKQRGTPTAELLSETDVKKLLDYDQQTRTAILRRIDELHAPPLHLQLYAYNPDGNRYLYRMPRVPFYGRTQEMTDLQDFLKHEKHERPFRWWMWTGAGGSGKSRLAQELCLVAEGQGWHVGFFPRQTSYKDWEQWHVEEPTLVVIDYVAERWKEMQAAIAALENSNRLKAPVRFLLLERDAVDEQGQWWDEFRRGATTANALDQSRYVTNDETWFRPLPTLSDDAIRKTIEYIFDEQDCNAPIDAVADAVAAIDKNRRPLFVALAADAVAGAATTGKVSVDEIRKWNPSDLAEHILKHEEDRWHSFDGNGNQLKIDEAHLNLLAFVTVAGRKPYDILPDLAARGVFAPTEHQCNSVWMSILTGYSTRDGDELELLPLEPDILGEAYVVGRLDSRPQFHRAANGRTAISNTSTAIQVAFELFPRETAAFAVRAVNDFGVRDGGKVLAALANALLSAPRETNAHGSALLEIGTVIRQTHESDVAESLIALLTAAQETHFADATRALAFISHAQLLAELPGKAAIEHADFALALLDEADALLDDADLRQRIRVIDCRAQIEEQRRNMPAAQQHAIDSLALEREKLKQHGESATNLRDVSCSLNKVGDVELAEGNRAAALDLYRASLDIFRRIVERFGESPESLRDVSVSLNKVGNVEEAEGNRAEALELYRESLDIRRRIVERFGESPESLRDVSASLIKVGNVELAEGSRATALDLYRESLDITRQIVERFGEAPQSLRDVSVSLDNVGNVELAEGNRAAAIDLYRQSLDIDRRIVDRFGESPESLRDVSVSLNKVGNVELAEGNRAAALDLYRESLDICRRIVERFGESPQSLRDVSVSLNNVGDVELEEGNRAAALDLYRESLDIRRRIVDRFGESPESLSDVVVSRVRMSQVGPESASEHLTEAKTIADRLAERNWLKANQRDWPEIISQMLSDLDDSGEQN